MDGAVLCSSPAQPGPGFPASQEHRPYADFGHQPTQGYRVSVIQWVMLGSGAPGSAFSMPEIASGWCLVTSVLMTQACIATADRSRGRHLTQHSS